MDIVNYYLGDDTGLNSPGADADPPRSSVTQSAPPMGLAAPVVFGGALGYPIGRDSVTAPGQWANGPVNGTVLDVTA